MPGQPAKLAICIPTHHGRAPSLRQLLDSVAAQVPAGREHEIEICVSDNASTDATGDVVGEIRSRIGIPVRYFRFEQDMRGVRNFLNVVDMAEAEYCWLVGSDDLIPPGAIARILAALDQLRDIPALSVNKLNFDRSLQRSMGPDHDLVLPSHPASSRMLTGLEEIASNLALGFTFMSAHIFRRHLWQEVVREIGVEGLCAMRHFPHTYVYLRIASAKGRWYWLADYCIIQRLDNFSILEENARLLTAYAEEVTDDLERVWLATLPAAGIRSDLMRRLFFLYWHPIAMFLCLADRRVKRSDQKRMRNVCVRRFRTYPIFWLTTYPVLWVPAPVCQAIFAVGKAIDRVVPLGAVVQRLQTVLAAVISRSRGGDRDEPGARAAADGYLSSQKSSPRPGGA